MLSATSIVSTYGISELHADVDGMLTCDLNALIIAAPDPSIRRSPPLDAGPHVMCEKPLALTVAGCDQIAAARDRSGPFVAYLPMTWPARVQAT